MSDPSAHPAKIGKYEVERVLGRGAMGVVYLARDPMIGRPVALKTVHLPQGLDADKVQEFRQRFLREARAAGRMNHPGVVTIYEADDGSGGGPPFIAMEYIQGDTWSARIKRGEKAHPDQLLPLVQELAQALAYAHRAGVVHRDIKPANIITGGEGHAKLMDFGIARVPTSELTQEGQFLGTPAYMSPEQVMGKPVDGRSDLFSLGTVCFEMLTGVKPFPGEEITVVTHKILQAPPEPLPEKNPDLPTEVGWMLNKLLAKDPENRYQSAGELVEDIRAYLGGATPPYASQGGAAESTLVAREATAALPAPPLQPEPKPDSPLATHADGRPAPPPPPPSSPPAPPTPPPTPPPAPPAASPSTPPSPPAQAPPKAGPAPRGSVPPAPPPKAGTGAPRKKGLGLLLAGMAVVALLVLAGAGGFLWWWTHRVVPPAGAPDGASPAGPVDPGTAVPAEAGPAPEPKTAEGPAEGPPAGSAASNPAPTPPPKPRPKPPAPPSTSPAPTPAMEPVPPPPPAAPSRDCTLDYSFSAGVLKGEYWLKVDGKTVAHEVIDRKFTMKQGEWSGTARVPSGARLVRFELKTEIQDLVSAHEERAEFAPGESRRLSVKLTKFKKELEFDWH